MKKETMTDLRDELILMGTYLNEAQTKVEKIDLYENHMVLERIKDNLEKSTSAAEEAKEYSDDAEASACQANGRANEVTDLLEEAQGKMDELDSTFSEIS